MKTGIEGIISRAKIVGGYTAFIIAFIFMVPFYLIEIPLFPFEYIFFGNDEFFCQMLMVKLDRLLFKEYYKHLYE